MEFSHRLKILQAVLFFFTVPSSFGPAQELSEKPEIQTPAQEAPVTDGFTVFAEDSTSQKSKTLPLIPESEWNELVQAVTSGKAASIRIVRAAVDFKRLSSLHGAEKLSELVLDSGRIEDVGLAEIVKYCPNLEHLRLRFSPITDAGARAIAQLKQLRHLNLPQSRLSGEGIRHLRNLPQLEMLRLGGSRIDDHAVAEIALLPQLESLHLIGPKLSEKSLEALAAAPELTCLYLDGCPMADEAWRQLKSAKPELHIHLDQPHHDQPPQPLKSADS